MGGGTTRSQRLEQPGDNWIQAILPEGSWDHKRRGCLGAGNTETKDRIPRSCLSSHPSISCPIISLAYPDYAEQEPEKDKESV